MRALQIVGVDGLERDLGAERLGRLRHLPLQLDVGLRDEVDPANPMQLRSLGESRRPAGCQDPLDTGDGHGGGPGDLEEVPAVHATCCHAVILLDRS
jgi:hypothetical protein